MHDELILELHNDLAPVVPYCIKQLMEEIKPITAMGLRVNVDIEYSDTSWEEKRTLPVDEELLNTSIAWAKAEGKKYLIDHDPIPMAWRN